MGGRAFRRLFDVAGTNALAGVSFLSTKLVVESVRVALDPGVDGPADVGVLGVDDLPEGFVGVLFRLFPPKMRGRFCAFTTCESALPGIISESV